MTLEVKLGHQLIMVKQVRPMELLFHQTRSLNLGQMKEMGLNCSCMRQRTLITLVLMVVFQFFIL